MRLWFVLVMLAMLGGVAKATPRPAGGGLLDAGIDGEYFPNTTLSGVPQFTRHDIRVRFDWGELLPVGGSTAAPLREFPRDNFSVRWTGQLMPRFTEVYTFKTVADEGVRLYIRPEGGTWATLIDHWAAHTQAVDTAAYAMTAGQRYDIKLEYWEGTGPASIALYWSSPSTPEEVVDAASVAATACILYLPTMMADAFRCQGAWGSKQWFVPLTFADKIKVSELDAQGWPTRDAGAGLSEQMHGRYYLQFTGRAKVRFRSHYYAARCTFYSGTNSYYEWLPAGVGYNPASNITTAEFTWFSDDLAKIEFVESQRDAGSPTNTGVTGVKLMRPINKASNSYCTPDSLLHPLYQALLRHYTVLRWYHMLGENEWGSRTTPGSDDHYGSSLLARPDTGTIETRGCLEDHVLMANECGRDLHVNVNGGGVSDAYLTNLARALKYGTDGVNPYTSYQTNPAYPPLNPNLNVYLEFKNEIWNYGGVKKYADAAVASNTVEGQIVNYDGTYVMGNWGPRWQALKTVRINQAFRAVFGDKAMGDRVRVYLFGQYDNIGVWFPIISFMDNYFNNGDGRNNVPDPHPPNYYVWGGGGAVYYSSTNSRANVYPEPLQNNLAVVPALASGAVALRPTNALWTFTGNAGVCNVRQPLTNATPVQLGTLGNTLGAAYRLGFKFTVGPSNLYVHRVGRYGAPGNGQYHQVRIYTTAGAEMGGYVDDVKPSQLGQYTYGWTRSTSSSGVRYPRPTMLLSNTTYYAMCAETAGGDQYYGSNTLMQSGPGYTIGGAAMYAGSGTNFIVTLPGPYSYGPVTFEYTVDPLRSTEGALGVPPYEAPRGTQCFFLAPGGTMSQSIQFPMADTCAVTWLSAGSSSLGGPAVVVSVDGAINSTQSAAYAGFQIASSEAFVIPGPGAHTITLRALAGNNAIFLGDLRAGSASAFFGPGCVNLPGSGDAYGESKSDWHLKMKLAIIYAQTWGLVPCSYEGGWALGGDGVRTPFMNFLQFNCAQTALAEQRAMDVWTGFGAYQFQRHYGQFPVFWYAVPFATNYPLPQGVIAHNRRLPAEARTNGEFLPCELSSGTARFMAGPYRYINGGIVNTLLDTRDTSNYWWVSWNIIAPAALQYYIEVATTSGGTVRVNLDNDVLVATGASGGMLTGTVFISKGLHALRVSAVNGAFNVGAVRVSVSGQPFLTVRGNGVLIPNGNLETSLSNSTDFGEACTVSGTVDHAFTLLNGGMSNLVLTATPAVQLAGADAPEFAVISQAAALVQPGSNTSVTIRYHPAAMGTHTATVVISNNATGFSPFMFAIKGTAVPEPLAALILPAIAGSAGAARRRLAACANHRTHRRTR